MSFLRRKREFYVQFRCIQVRTCLFKCLKVTDASRSKIHDENKGIIHFESAPLLSERLEMST